MTKPKALILFHGAGGDKNHPVFLALEDQLSIPVIRKNFPYRDKNPGKKAGPNSMKILVESINEAGDETSANLGIDKSTIIYGGRSMGGRAASIANSQGLTMAGLLLLSYPLHPPGKPDKLRIEHLPEITAPVLVIQGKKDTFGKPEEVEKEFATVPTDVTIKEVEGAHDPKNQESEIVDIVKKWIDTLN